MGKSTVKTTDHAKPAEAPFAGNDTPRWDESLDAPEGHVHGAISDRKHLTKDMRKTHRESGK